MTDDDSGVSLPEAVLNALRQGRKVEAIKLLRAQGNLDLKGAKDAIERHVRSDPVLQRRLMQSQRDSLSRLRYGAVIVAAIGSAIAYWMSR